MFESFTTGRIKSGVATVTFVGVGLLLHHERVELPPVRQDHPPEVPVQYGNVQFNSASMNGSMSGGGFTIGDRGVARDFVEVEILPS